MQSGSNQPPNGPFYPPMQGQWPQQPMTPQQPGMQPQWQQGQPQWQQPGQPQWTQPGQQQWPQQPPLSPEVLQQMQYEAYMQQMPQMPTMQQPAEPPVQRKKRRTGRGGGRWRWLILVLALAAAAAAVWFFFGDRLFPSGFQTALVERDTVGATHVGDALIVRNETAFDDEGVQNIEYVAQEGSTVFRGDVICYVYSTGYSSKEMTVLQDYRDQIKEYQQTLLKTETAYDQKMTRLESEVLQRGLEVRALVQGARGSLLNQEGVLETAIEQRQAYFRSKYSSDARLNRLYDDEATQQQRIDSWIKQKVAVQESIVSFYTDGFEYALTPGEYEKYTPSEVRSMINGVRPATSTAQRGRTNLYRLVRDNNYAVLMLVKDEVWNPVEGMTLKLVLEQFKNTEVEAKVLSFTRSGGELLLRLAVMGDVSDVLYMRSCSASLVESTDCLKVPEKARYIKNGETGIVLVNGDSQGFLPVEVLRSAGGYLYIRPKRSDIVLEGQRVRLF